MSAQQFCTHCGSKLESSANFCTSCGSPVSNGQDSPIASSESVSQEKTTSLEGLDIMASGEPAAAESSSAQETHQMGYSPSSIAPLPRVESSTSTPRSYRQPAPDQRLAQSGSRSADGKKTGLIIAVAVLAVLLVIAIAFVAFNAFAGSSSSDGESSQTQTQQDDSTASQGSPSDQDEKASSDPTSSEDRAIYRDLSSYYDDLGVFDERISKVADTFNSTYLVKSMSKRQDAAEDAFDLYSQVSEAYYEVSDYSVPSSSEYYASYNDIVTCYYDCLMRIQFICSAWDNSLSYADPKGHSDEICEPLARVRVNGDNKYLTDFESLYPDAKPASPRD